MVRIKKNSKKRENVIVTPKANGRKVNGGAKSVLIAVGIMVLPLVVGLLASVITIAAQENFKMLEERYRKKQRDRER